MKYILLLFFLAPLVTVAQYGGESTFQFLNVTNSAKYESLGGANVSLDASDLHFAMVNPALIDSTLDNQFGGTWGSIYIMRTGIGIGNTSYARSIKGHTYTGGIRFINYGVFKAYDEDGIEQGNVTASEYALSFATSRELLPKIYYGIQVKPIASFLADYSSFAIAADIGVAYKDTANHRTFGILVSNLGTQLKTYTKDNQEDLPFNAQLGVTQKLKHAPLRFSITYNYLHQWDVSYETILKKEEAKLITETDEEAEEEDWWMASGRNLLSHLVIGTEILLGENVYGAIGFDFKKQNELKMLEKSGGAGFSLGFGFKISNFRFSYGRTKYHAAGATNFISITTNFDDFTSSKQTVNNNVSN